MLISVVINTYNRGSSLARTLDALRHQTFPDFEVVVVNGPSFDDTEDVLARWSGSIRRLDMGERNLGRSRNLGIAAAAGEIVAFIDDDSLPEPDWLEGLAAAYTSPEIGGAGGVVLDPSGTRVQYRYSLCDRTGQTRFDQQPPLEPFLQPGADPFLYLQGTNCSFRRACLVEVGGFDEGCEYMYDEVEVCLRLIDLGYRLVPIDGAAVHHKRLASDYRTASGMALNPYPAVKNRALFALRHGAGLLPRDQLVKSVRDYVRFIKDSADACLKDGSMSHIQHDRFFFEADRGLRDGLEIATQVTAPAEPFPQAPAGDFLPFPTLRPEESRLCLAFVSGEYPPGYFGGIGRFTQEFSTAIASRGHEVHVVTMASGEPEVALEDGVWVHRVAVQDRDIAGLAESPLRANWLSMSALYHEVSDLHERRGLDAVSAPLWNCESLLCSLDGRFPTVTTLTTSLRTIAGLHPSWAGTPPVEKKLQLEEVTARAASFLMPISRAIAREANEEFGPLPGRAEVIPLGVTDRRVGPAEPVALGQGVHLLFVGRLERRKGVDLLLDVLPGLLRTHPELHATVAGASTPNTELGETYPERFRRLNKAQLDVLRRVEFPGHVDDDDLYRLYEGCDVFCAPSRFESLGLVVIEAMMMGKPIVAGAVGGIAEIVDPSNGFLVEPDNAQALKAALLQLVEDSELRRTMGKSSRALYDSYWNIDTAVDRMLSGFRSFTAAHQPGITAGREELVARLAGIVEDIESIGRSDAEQAAGALIDSTWHPVDYQAALRRLWNQPDRTFVAGLYTLFLHRKPDVLGMRGHLSRLRLGTDRATLIKIFAASPEGRANGIDSSWFADIDSWECKRRLRSRAGQLLKWAAGRLGLRSERIDEAEARLAALEERVGRLEDPSLETKGDRR